MSASEAGVIVAAQHPTDVEIGAMIGALTALALSLSHLRWRVDLLTGHDPPKSTPPHPLSQTDLYR